MISPSQPFPDSPALNVLVVGATGGTGALAVSQLLDAGHSVTAFSRHASDTFPRSARLAPFDGDVMNPADIGRAMPGHDAVIVTLGISENPVRVRLFGPSGTPADVRSRGTAHVIEAMREHHVGRIVVQSSYGVGESRARLKWIDRLFFSLLLKPQIDDTDVQEEIVRASGMDWVLAQPVHLTDNPGTAIEPYVSMDGNTRAMKVTRSSVARFLARALRDPAFIHKTVAISG